MKTPSDCGLSQFRLSWPRKIGCLTQSENFPQPAHHSSISKLFEDLCFCWHFLPRYHCTRQLWDIVIASVFWPTPWHDQHGQSKRCRLFPETVQPGSCAFGNRALTICNGNCLACHRLRLAAHWKASGDDRDDIERSQVINLCHHRWHEKKPETSWDFQFEVTGPMVLRWRVSTQPRRKFHLNFLGRFDWHLLQTQQWDAGKLFRACHPWYPSFWLLHWTGLNSVTRQTVGI